MKNKNNIKIILYFLAYFVFVFLLFSQNLTFNDYKLATKVFGLSSLSFSFVLLFQSLTNSKEGLINKKFKKLNKLESNISSLLFFIFYTMFLISFLTLIFGILILLSNTFIQDILLNILSFLGK